MDKTPTNSHYSGDDLWCPVCKGTEVSTTKTGPDMDYYRCRNEDCGHIASDYMWNTACSWREKLAKVKL